jgi:hypothetical protein
MPQLPKDESLSAQGPLQCTSALHHINALMFGAAILSMFQNLNAGAVQLSFFAPRAGSLDEVSDAPASV